MNYGISPSDSPYYDNSYNGNFLSFELTDKTTTDVKDASTTLKDLALLELRCNPNEVNRVRNEVKTLNDFIDSNSLYFRIATTNEDYILELINICKSLNLKKSGEYNSYFSLGDFRAFRYLSKQGDKPFALKNKNRVSDFSNNMDYSEIRTIKMKSIGYTRYDYIVQNNIFINSPTLNYEVTKNNIYIESWYNMKFGLDLHIQDFLTLMDYLNQQGMAMKSVLSYGLLKDSGNFVFDMDSYQRAFTVVEADGEGVVVSDLGEEQEATIDQRIEDLIELFKI